MRKHRLLCHPSTPPRSVTAVEVEIAENSGELDLSFLVSGAQGLVIPEFQSRDRADFLWRTTCFECFLGQEGRPGYLEINASPSGRWASYAFDGFRQGMRQTSQAFVMFAGGRMSAEPGKYICEVSVDVSATWAGPMKVGLAAVIEEQGGTKSYWALAHPPGAPDFHDPNCFSLTLPP